MANKSRMAGTALLATKEQPTNSFALVEQNPDTSRVLYDKVGRIPYHADLKTITWIKDGVMRTIGHFEGSIK